MAYALVSDEETRRIDYDMEKDEIFVTFRDDGEYGFYEFSNAYNSLVELVYQARQAYHPQELSLYRLAEDRMKNRFYLGHPGKLDLPIIVAAVIKIKLNGAFEV